MKKLFFIASIFLTALTSFAQEHQQPLASPRAFVKTDNISITYGQPSKKDREIFGALVPYGQVWRTGANEATEITFNKKATVAGKAVAAGTYSLFTIPEEKKWTIIFNKQLGQWGAYEYEKHKKKDILNIKVPVQTLDKVQEKLLYEVRNDSLFIQWDKTAVAIPIIFKK